MLKLVTQQSKIRDLLWLVIALLTVIGLSRIGLLTGAQNTITEIRESYSQRSASGELIFIGIDKESMDQIGVWPWPRKVHAQIVDRLMDAGVEEIGVDIDFSSASSPEQDTIFAASLERAGGAVILPIFVQDRSASREDNRLSTNRPLAIFEKHTWLASVNVTPDTDGVVRRFPLGQVVDGEYVASMPSVLGGVFEQTKSNVIVNYSISPKTVPKYSVADLLSDKVSAAELKGKTVMLGAQAVELRDNFTTPVHGVLPGAMIQILAAETLAQGLEPGTLNPLLILLLSAAFVFCATRILRKFYSSRSIIYQLVFFAIMALAMEVFGFFAFKHYTLIIPTAELNTFLLVVGMITSLREININIWKLLFANAENANSQQILEQVITDNAHGIVIVDETGAILKVNNYARGLFDIGVDLSESTLNISQFPREIDTDVKRVIDALKNQTIDKSKHNQVMLPASTEGAKPLTLEYSVTASSLKQVVTKGGGTEEEHFIACVTIADVTTRIEQENKLAYLARYDDLTGALRRSAFIGELKGLYDCQPGVAPCTIFAINLHRFKTINDSLGQDVGDQVLQMVVDRVNAHGDEITQICRLSGDSFAFFIQKNLSPSDIVHFSENLTLLIGHPFVIGKASVKVGLRIGITSSSFYDHPDAAQVVKDAEIALDQARQASGGDAFEIFHKQLSDKQEYARSVENNLWHALEKNELSIAYQPQIDLETDTLVGVEALVRWIHPELGFISPAEFVEISEANGYIDKLGFWVLSQACADALHLPSHMTVAVNVSPLQFIRCDIVQMVKDALARSGLPASRLHIEITEVGFLDATDEVVAKLEALREMGICLALDDFGTGFSSLGYFANFPINKIKVDQMFVRTLERGSDNEAIIRSVKELSEGLNLKMICEGVETEEQLNILRDIGVHEGQGYFFGKPQPLQSIIQMANGPQKIRA
jgi:diguanylate cyclase (GGDEF)-like protein